MIEKGQVFVRAINKDGRWDTVDALDLDDESFRRFILDKLCDMGVIVSCSPPIIDDEERELASPPFKERTD